MFSGAQVSLYPMSGDFVGVIMSSLSALDPYRDRFRFQTDDLSTLFVGPPEELFPAMRDLHIAASRTGIHCVMHATVSRGCPGEPDDPICTPILGRQANSSMEARIEAALAAVQGAALTGQPIAAQFSLYPLGADRHMEEIYGCIDLIKRSGVFGGSKNFCTTLRGDAGPVFAVLREAFLRFGTVAGHLALDLTVSANSPTAV